MLFRTSFTSLWRLKLPHVNHRMNLQQPLLIVHIHQQSAFLQVFNEISDW